MDGEKKDFSNALAPPVTTCLEVFDVAGMQDPESSAYAMSQAYVYQPMRLTTGPLFRTLLFQLAERLYGLTFIFHHVLIDACGLDIFQQQLSQLYTSYREGEAPALPEPALQMADFATWEREHMRPENQVYQMHLEWWRDYLKAPLPPPLDLRMGWRAPPQTPPPVPDCLINLPIPAVSNQRIREVARDVASTPFILCFSAFAVLLHRRTGVSDFLVGIYVSDRKRMVAQEMIGMFAAMVPARIQVDNSLIIRQFIQSLHREMMEIRSHQELPFEDLQVQLRKEGLPVHHLGVIRVIVPVGNLEQAKIPVRLPFHPITHTIQRGAEKESKPPGYRKSQPTPQLSIPLALLLLRLPILLSGSDA